MSHHLGTVFLVAAIVIGGETEAARAVRTRLARQIAAQESAQADRDAAGARVVELRKAIEKKVASNGLERLKVDVRGHPGRYLLFSGTGYSTAGTVHGDRRLVLVSAANNSPFALRVESAYVSEIHGSDNAMEYAPLSLTGTIEPGQTHTFREADIVTDPVEGHDRNVRVNVDTVEIVDMTKTAVVDMSR